MRLSHVHLDDDGASVETSQLPQSTILTPQPGESSQQEAPPPHSVDNELGTLLSYPNVMYRAI